MGKSTTGRTSRRSAGVAVVVVLGLVAIGCSSTKSYNGPAGIGDAATETTPTTALSATPTGVSTAPARPSPGCSSSDGSVKAGPAQQAGAMDDQTVTVDGATRTYRLYVPPSSSDDAPMPMVLNLHGLTSNIAEQVALTQFEALAATEHFIVVTPQGAGNPAKWGFDNTPQNADLPFFNALLDQVEAQRCVDTARVYSTGISNGGMMSATLICQMGDRIAAVGLVSGIREPDNCQPPDTPAPLMVFWGTKDVVLPFLGGVGPGLTGARPLVAPTLKHLNSRV